MESQPQNPELRNIPENFHLYILSVSEKLPVSKFRYFGKYIIQLYGYMYVHVSGQDILVWRDKTASQPWNYGTRDALAFYVFQFFLRI